MAGSGEKGEGICAEQRQTTAVMFSMAKLKRTNVSLNQSVSKLDAYVSVFCVSWRKRAIYLPYVFK